MAFLAQCRQIQKVRYFWPMVKNVRACQYYPDGDWTFVALCEKVFQILKTANGTGAADAIDHGTDTLTGLAVRGQGQTNFKYFEDLYVSDQLRDCLFGMEDSHDIHLTVKTVADFIKQSMSAFRFMYGFNEKRESFVCPSTRFYPSPTTIADAEVLKVEIEKDTLPKAIYMPRLETVDDRGYADKHGKSVGGSIYLTVGSDGQLLNAAFVEQIQPHIWYMGRKDTNAKADFRVRNDSDTFYVFINLAKFQTEGGLWVEFNNNDGAPYDAQGEYITWIEWYRILTMFYISNVRLRGIGYNMWTVYQFNMKLAVGSIPLRLYPRRISIDIEKQETTIRGWTSQVGTI